MVLIDSRKFIPERLMMQEDEDEDFVSVERITAA